MGLAYYALPAEKKAQPYWRLCAKFLAEGDYSRSFEMFRRAYDLAPEPSLHLGAYLAALAKEADWLRVLIAQPPAACSPEDLRYFRACLAWAAETPAAVLAVSEEPVQAAPKDEARPPRGLLWLRFMRARALMEMGRNTSAFDILDNQVGPHLKIMTNDPRVAINFATVVVQAGEKCGEYRQALVCALLAADFLDRVEDKSWDGTRRELRESIARLKERLGSASETANPVSVRPSAPARE
jgi:tetratricopeptide (TPR) repeat protein